MELLPQLPQPSVVVADRLLKKEPPLLVEQIWLIRKRDTGRTCAAASICSVLLEWMHTE